MGSTPVLTPISETPVVVEAAELLAGLPRDVRTAMIRQIRALHEMFTSEVAFKVTPALAQLMDRLGRMDREQEQQVANLQHEINDSYRATETRLALDGLSVFRTDARPAFNAASEAYPVFGDGTPNTVAYGAILTVFSVLAVADKVSALGRFTPEMFWHLLRPVTDAGLLDRSIVGVPSC